MNALGDQRVVDYVNENFVNTYLKVGTFQIINGQKVGGNVASYFCLADGSVVHAIPGQVSADKFLTEARWAYEIRKAALTHSTDLENGKVDMRKYTEHIGKAHADRYFSEQKGLFANKNNLPDRRPLTATAQNQVHWLLARSPLARIETVYPTVWTQILNEQMSTLPVAQR